MLLPLGHRGNSGLDQGLEAQGLGTRGSLSLLLQAPPQGTAHSSSHWGRAGERGAGPFREGPGERPLEGPVETPPTALPPEAAHMILCKRSIWLRSGCSVCKGSLGPPTASITLLQKAFLPQRYRQYLSGLKSAHMVPPKGGESKQRGRP